MAFRGFGLCYILIVAIYIPIFTSDARRLMRAPTARMLSLVPTPQPLLSYHGGPLVTAKHVRLHLLWYGTFSSAQQAAVTDFIGSLQAKFTSETGKEITTVRRWWATARKYKDAAGIPAAARVSLGMVFTDTSYSRGKNITNADMASMVEERYRAYKKTRNSSMYVVMTADDVLVEDFCLNSCGTHEAAMGGKMPFLWVGNAAKQCPGLCAWPFAVELYGPPGPALTPPSGEAATDGMIINLATLLAGAVTNPFASGYFQGDATVPLEAGSACQGQFGPGSYPGYAGHLLTESSSGASYNAIGVNGRRFLLPALWDPSIRLCRTL
ncbi:hypothetical protein KP509_35G043400 [Ceratopteris richardii]|uniref:Protein EXORDIUM-like 2 n=1 Tax=Ceratopteris richardii TaxID=49495 RepID=A0A8T2QHK5_CERRI|nr:hypothetical protein KP509_35G043400 [Ceratopteris richardii]